MFLKMFDHVCCDTALSASSMVKMVYSVYRGAIRIPRGLLPVVEMDSGKSSSSSTDCLTY